MASSAALLPSFLRRLSIQPQIKLFNHLNQLERQRAQSALSPESPFNVLQATHRTTKDLNRYNDILPYMHSRILVNHPGQQQLSASYINASRITTPPRLRSSLPQDWQGYIATQAPLPHTQAQFWRMIDQQNVHVIVCLTPVSQDRSKRAQKAERYWPRAGETDELDADLFVRNLDEMDSEDQIVYRQLELWNPSIGPSGLRRQILLVHYQGWPDHGVPTQTMDLRDILYRIRAWKAEQQRQHQQQINFGPIAVNCSAGCGRTGTFCVVDTALSVLEHTRYPYLAPPPNGQSSSTNGVQIDADPGVGLQGDAYDWNGNRDIIFEALSSFREERMLMVQTAAQYYFCYEVVRDLCLKDR
ncbi:protein tyrosine phosphatase, non-receptor type 11 [Mortierella polycephala]|uniref:Protein tyrosine phosphatase, non-receptor type 11 n=1 Tax=Mortierella polycephala TaxID=41804 RepID=A0A9P6PP05_9FUNG|nr:protein tyrosine phosphatase, non-receptor type 11 [Mortierella polycephala]